MSEGGIGRETDGRKRSRRHLVFLSDRRRESPARTAGQPCPCSVQPPAQPWGRGRQSGVQDWVGWPRQLLNDLPPPPLAATVGPHQPATLFTGNNGELSGAVLPAASSKRGTGRGPEDSNASLSWASGPLACSVQAMGEAQQLVGGPTLGCTSSASSFCILQGTLPRGSPTLGCYLLIMVGGRQEERAVQ